MEIRVSKSAVDARMIQEVDKVIALAKKSAERGETSFSYNMPLGIGLNVYVLGNEVEAKTNNTVCIPPRGIKGGGLIVFSIAEE